MSGTVKVTFKTSASSVEAARDIVENAGRQASQSYSFDQGEITDLFLVSFEPDETVTLTAVELDARVKAAVDAALQARDSQ